MRRLTLFLTVVYKEQSEQHDSKKKDYDQYCFSFHLHVFLFLTQIPSFEKRSSLSKKSA